MFHHLLNDKLVSHQVLDRFFFGEGVIDHKGTDRYDSPYILKPDSQHRGSRVANANVAKFLRFAASHQPVDIESVAHRALSFSISARTFLISALASRNSCRMSGTTPLPAQV